MKKEATRKLHLSRVTVQNLGIALDRDVQKAVKGGSEQLQLGTTNIPVICGP